MAPSIVLGSSSTFRRQILKEAGIECQLKSPNIDEKFVGVELRQTNNAAALVLAVSRAKADALIANCPNTILITCDQVVVHNGVIREKPLSEAECRLFLESYAVAPAETWSGVYVINTRTGKCAMGVDVCTQHFKAIPSDVIERVVAKGQVMKCSGGFMIDEPMLEPYLGQIIGTPDSVIGMPVALLQTLLLTCQSTSASLDV